MLNGHGMLGLGGPCASECTDTHNTGSMEGAEGPAHAVPMEGFMHTDDQRLSASGGAGASLKVVCSRYNKAWSLIQFYKSVGSFLDNGLLGDLPLSCKKMDTVANES